jgi:hypothetical protein
MKQAQPKKGLPLISAAQLKTITTMILYKKEAIEWLYNYARTNAQLDFLMEGEKKMKRDKNYDLVREYVLTYPCPAEFWGFVSSDFVFVKNKAEHEE